MPEITPSLLKSPRPMNAKQASRAAVNNLKDVKFHARRNQHGLTVGDVTSLVHGLPVDRVARFIRYGILICEPASNFLAWGKDVSGWLLKNRLPHPVTIADLIEAQAAMAANDPEMVTYAPPLPPLEKKEEDIPQQDEVNVTEAHVEFLKVRGYDFSLEQAKKFVGNMPEADREGFLADFAQWKPVTKSEEQPQDQEPTTPSQEPPAATSAPQPAPEQGKGKKRKS